MNPEKITVKKFLKTADDLKRVKIATKLVKHIEKRTAKAIFSDLEMFEVDDEKKFNLEFGKSIILLFPDNIKALKKKHGVDNQKP